jgi:conjugal transfer/type IV secretion protein DotA/TraY
MLLTSKYKQAITMFLTPVLLALLFFAMSPSAHAAGDEAANPSAAMEQGMNEIFAMSVNVGRTPQSGEYAHYWFNKVFGGFIFAPWGEGNGNYDLNEVSLLSHAIGFTNIPALILGVIILFYTVIGGAINTAASGEVLGKDWSSVWLPIRTAGGFGLIMPAEGVGKGVMSISQLFIIWLVLIGSNTGTVLYKGLIDRITGYNPVVDTPKEPVGIKPSADMLKMLVCSSVKVEQMGSNPRSNGRTLATATIGEPGQLIGKYKTEYAFASQKVDYGYKIAESDLNTLTGKMHEAEFRRVEFGPGNSCGSIEGYDENRYTETDIAPSYKTQAVNAGMSKARELMGNQLKDLMKIAVALNDIDIAKTYYAISKDKENPLETEKSELVVHLETIADQFNSLANNYSINTGGLIHQAMMSSDSFTNKFNNEVKAGGWGGGGLWYYELGEYSSLSPKVIEESHSGISFTEPFVCSKGSASKDCIEFQGKMTQAMSLVDYMVARGIKSAKQNGTAVTTTNVIDEMMPACPPDEACTIGKDTVERVSTSLGKAILNHFADSSAADDPVGSPRGDVSPFQTVSSIGHTINNYAAIFWTLGSLVYAAIDSAAFTASDFVAGSVMQFFSAGMAKTALGFFVGWLKWVGMTVMAVIMTLASTGFVLAYMIPFLPVITWITMIAGYLITVVEAPVAIPLAVIQAIAPEGSGILGTRLERAMQLLAMAVLKPSLMVVGLIASIHLANIVFQIMNTFFFVAAEHVLHGGPFDIAAVILLYTMVSFSICKLMITVMHKLPEQILDWFASGVGRSFGENEAGQIGEAATSGLKQTTGSVSSGLGHSIRDKIREKKANERAGLLGGKPSPERS